MFSKVIAGSILALYGALVSSSGVQFAGINIAGFDFGCGTDVYDFAVPPSLPFS